MSARIVQDRQSGQPRGIAFVEMSMPWEGGCLHAQPAGLHGENPDGKKGNRKMRLPRKMGTGIQKN